jgi:2-oxoglutarate/2-oxoacid ferredoxin oxidoreductase subunit alpha
MATTDVALHEASGRMEPKRVVNNMSIQVATVNGSGSQSSNTVLLRSIFQMGIPVSGKNLFPSNIAGLPTWYTIRANKDGYIARKKEIDFLVAMNAETAQEDVMSLASGAAVLYDEPLKLNQLRTDLTFYAVPYDKLVAPVCPEAKLRKLVKNMIYVGVVAKLLGIDMSEVEKAIRKQFSAKVKAANLNLAAVQAGFDYASSSLTKEDPYIVQRMDKTAGKIIIDGNSAAALGCMFAGCTVVAWYPITPSSSLPETMIEYMKDYRIGKDGKATFRHRHGNWRRMVWCASHDGDRWPRHFVDGGICGTRVLRGNPRRYLGYPACRTLDWPANTHFPGRHSLHCLLVTWGYQELDADSLLG